ncbi:hypothetical protein PpBr36_02825 [Pyricularia pennisetigena]|uniref:hypothetical protein n=1 Tax=Pyricularia pennisetigena TaxID=1578925 RepID=UPI0011522B3E|nr:hypothetical protein PpBr36_02825 [Pyricularia pennisetigena]TLS30116.1 hypothetical protein PpBr36_02825 [Pyricularia pennisetigena]
MASLFQSFRGSAMPKRLLRYALARLDLLDSDALDLDNLDLAIGRNTVLEFRDVGIKLPKLAKLLGLPPTFTLLKARVVLLRITIPMDIYSSSLKIEVDRVDVQLKVESKDDIDARSRTTTRGPTDVVPNTVDLAQSFLEHQSPKEKEELEAALAAETQDVGASLVLDEDEDDEDEGSYGTGQALSLPAFLANFLQGIVDRTQIQIRGVTFQLDVSVPLEPNVTAPDVVTVKLSLGQIDVEGVTTSLGPHEEDRPKIVHKEGKRHVSLQDITAFLISEANVFSTFERTASVPPSLSPQSSAASALRSPVSRESSMSFQEQELEGRSTQVPGFEDNQGDSEVALNIPYELSDEDCDQEPGNETAASSMSTPRASILQDFFTHRDESFPQSSTPYTAVASDTHLAADQSNERPPQSSPSLTTHNPISLTNSVLSNSSSGSSGQEATEDLTESHLYTHEDAESMYMSAFSQHEPTTQSVVQNELGENDLTVGASSPQGTRDEQSSSLGAPYDLQDSQVSSTSELRGLEVSPGLDTSTVSEQSDSSPAPINPASPHANIEARAKSSIQGERHDRESQSQNECPTPREPTRLAKKVLALDTLSLYLPSSQKSVHVVPLDGDSSSGEPQPLSPNLASSAFPHIPGAFGASTSLPPIPSPMSSTPIEVGNQEPNDGILEAILSPVSIQFDASIGFILAMVVSKLLGAISPSKQEPAQETTTANTNATNDATPHQAVKITLQAVSVLFLERLGGVSEASDSIFGVRTSNFDADILLQAQLRNVQCLHSSDETTIDTESFTFGYAGDDNHIISFDRSKEMMASIKDAIPSSGSEISVKLQKAAPSSKIEIATLPLQIRLDLRRLDETFSWFGGLSSFLNMGSSIASINGIGNSQPAKPQARPASRGVKFDTPINPDDRSATSDNKINMRINAVRMDLIGKDCNVVLETSAFKLVSRDEGIGIALRKIQVHGPYSDESGPHPPISVTITGTRVEYSMAPKEADLERLLELISPSKLRDTPDDDEIMVDTLLRQRRKGSVLRLKFDNVAADISNIPLLGCLPSLGEDLARLGTVAKYLPEDDRPGLMSLVLVRNAHVSVDVGGRFGVIAASMTHLDVAHVTVPSLLAVAARSLEVNRNQIEELVGSSLLASHGDEETPVLVVRLIGGTVEPTITVKLRGLNVEYRVPTIIDLLNLSKDATPQDFEASLAASVAHLGEQAHVAIVGTSVITADSTAMGQGRQKMPVVQLYFLDCVVGLNPLAMTSKMGIVLSDSCLKVWLEEKGDAKATWHIKQASILLIDDVALLDPEGKQNLKRHVQRPSDPASTKIWDMDSVLCAQGFVSISQIRAAIIRVKAIQDEDGQRLIDVEVQDNFLVLETCADSTQTLISLGNALKPPTPPSKENKFKTEIVPIEDMLASISQDAFGKAEGDYNFDDDFGEPEDSGWTEDDLDEDLDIMGTLGSQDGGQNTRQLLFDATSSSMMSDRTTTQYANDEVIFSGFSENPSHANSPDMSVENAFFASVPASETPQPEWKSAKMREVVPKEAKVKKYPLKIKIRDMHLIWNLYDGYDWQRTRETIGKTVEEIQAKAYERRARMDRRMGYHEEDGLEEEAVSDFLFNSIYIGIPSHQDPRELSQNINQELYGINPSDTESVATTAFTTTTSRVGGTSRPKGKRLKLTRSKHHKITFELSGVNAVVRLLEPGSEETQSLIRVHIRDLDVYDHVPTSTWKRFAMYDEDHGPREMGVPMVDLKVRIVRPVLDVTAEEIVMFVNVLPLRLHVDQDALDFITRFFGFKDDTIKTTSSPSDVPFIQRAEIYDIPVKLDFKPKRVDYAGIRSGRTTEFMNFIILDNASMVMRHAIIYGALGFERFGEMLNDVWMPEIKRHQLPGVLAGLAPVRSLVDVGSGFRHLYEIPIREYKRNGRVVRSIGKGAAAFARTTGTELIKLGAKVAIGTQNMLQGAEGLLVETPEQNRYGGAGPSTVQRAGEWEEIDDSEEDTRHQISLYANQPTGVIQGLRHGYRSLSRDISIARQAIIAVPGEVRESSSATGAAKAVLEKAPIFIFRPAIGATKAIGQTLLGATNSLDPQNLRRMDNKYKPDPKS